MTDAPHPLRVAVVGSGPSGFYAAGHLLASDLAVEVDLIDRLPTPWGLVRLGVAPDHPNIKAVSRVFEKIAARPGFRFLGNVEVGRDLSHAELAARYDAVLYACGAQTDRRMGIDGEDLPGSWPATAFVAWYNGHPDFDRHAFDLAGERAVVVGNGNVAMDVARMLALTPEELGATDTADHAIAALAASGVQEIVVLGRRGPVQAAFTTPELQELGELVGADVAVDAADLELDAASAAELDHEEHIAHRNLAVLRDYAGRAPAGKGKTVRLRFLAAPVRITGTDRVEGVDVVRNRLEQQPDGSIRAAATDVVEHIPCGIVLRSVGYRGVAVDGVPFDERRGTIPNVEGRVVDADGAHVPGLYCAGWIKRGPSGVIGTNKKDATETVEHLIADAHAGSLVAAGHVAEEIDGLLAGRGVEVVDGAGWGRIDAAEKAAGAPQGRPRVKLCSWDALLGTARAG